MYDCGGNRWLNNLYSLRAKWCSAFSKKNFSRGVLSPQRSESINHSIKREKESGENYKCSKGNVEMAFPLATNLERKKSTEVIPENIISVQELSSSQGNVGPTLNLLSNANPNDQSLHQSTITSVGYCPPFYFDPRTAGDLTQDDVSILYASNSKKLST
ncbi:hypothetical protein Cgig2_019679 [Carnegiea gigantea]|uniref:Uncharacterized protein n=1 Tax=Carnegiea gigantea TaxID=171969 RepID=A0A9Q1K1F1_9CARY|nr:hypothetical protein Cgig2_019679 [Carnegiea gigantea]